MAWNGSERRNFVRIVILCKVRVIANSRTFFSHTENIGEGGVKIVLREELEPRTMVELQIMISPEKTIKCMGEIRWVAKKMESIEKQYSLFDLGVHFTEIDDSDRLYIRKLVVDTINLEKRQNE